MTTHTPTVTLSPHTDGYLAHCPCGWSSLHPFAAAAVGAADRHGGVGDRPRDPRCSPHAAWCPLHGYYGCDRDAARSHGGVA